MDGIKEQYGLGVFTNYKKSSGGYILAYRKGFMGFSGYSNPYSLW